MEVEAGWDHESGFSGCQEKMAWAGQRLLAVAGKVIGPLTPSPDLPKHES